MTRTNDSGKTLTLTLMDPPYESARTTTAFRLIDAALRAALGQLRAVRRRTGRGQLDRRTGEGRGDVGIVNPPALDRDVRALIDSGVPVHYVADDAAAMGIDEPMLVGGLRSVARSELPALFERFDHVWRW